MVGLGLGATMGLLAIDQNDKATAAGCDADTCPNNTAAGFASTARDFATGADIGLIAGGAFAALGATLYLTAPERPESASLRIGPTRGGAQLLWGGHF